MKVEAIMTTNVVCCTGGTSIEDVAKMMTENDCGVLPVIEDEDSRRVVGILTDRDIVCRTLGDGKDPKKTTASDCMTTKVHLCDKDTNVDDCLSMMERHHIRRVPVVGKDQACIGLVSLTNIAESMPVQTTGNLVREITEPLRHDRFGRKKSARP